jgi:rubrerythrin
MGKSIKGSQTEKNLLAAFAGESQARNRYTYFVSAARRKAWNKLISLPRRIMKRACQDFPTPGGWR